MRTAPSARPRNRPSGQGHQTLVSQLLADELEILPSDIEVDYLDSVDAPTEYGSAASRMAVMLSGRPSASPSVLENAEELAADHWGVSSDGVQYRDGSVERVDGDDSLSLADLADIDADRDERLTQVSYNYDHPATDHEEFDEAFRRKFPVYPTAAFGANAPIVEVDVETGEVDILKFYTVRDCGTMLNPMIVEGQAHGGIAQGVGAALLEEFGYEDDGQPQAITLFDYLLPSIENVPEIEMEHTVTPSPYTETGAKGVGEGGMIDAPASIATSINAALDLSRSTNRPIASPSRQTTSERRSATPISNVARSGIFRTRELPLTGVRPSQPDASLGAPCWLDSGVASRCAVDRTRVSTLAGNRVSPATANGCSQTESQSVVGLEGDVVGVFGAASSWLSASTPSSASVAYPQRTS